jgi:hypothetical protein
MENNSLESNKQGGGAQSAVKDLIYRTEQKKRTDSETEANLAVDKRDRDGRGTGAGVSKIQRYQSKIPMFRASTTREGG